ncbi:MAG: MobA/MobL family protein [Rickettsiaceae bacterium]|nr:MobA/MobL family protein [Rickettsiaceae bacterium]
MAIYSMNISMVKRSLGRNAVATSAYNSRSKLKLYFKNVKTGGKRQGRGYKIYDYRKRKGLTFSKIIAPENAPEWVYDREVLWNKCEEVELRHNSQTARKIMLALPIELSKEQNHQLIEEFSRKYLLTKGMVVDINVHYDNPGNPQEACKNNFNI